MRFLRSYQLFKRCMSYKQLTSDRLMALPEAEFVTKDNGWQLMSLDARRCRILPLYLATLT